MRDDELVDKIQAKPLLLPMVVLVTLSRMACAIDLVRCLYVMNHELWVAQRGSSREKERQRRIIEATTALRRLWTEELEGEGEVVYKNIEPMLRQAEHYAEKISSWRGQRIPEPWHYCAKLLATAYLVLLDANQRWSRKAMGACFVKVALEEISKKVVSERAIEKVLSEAQEEIAWEAGL